MIGTKNKLNNLTESLLPILIFNWIFGHQLMQYKINGFKFIQTFFYFIIVISIYCAALGYAVLFFINRGALHNSEIIYSILIGTNIFIMTVNFTLGWIHRNKILLINIRSLNVDKKLTRIGINLNKEKGLKFTIYITIYWATCALTLNFLGILWYKDVYTWWDSFILITSIHHPIHVNSLIEMLFCLLLRNMRIRFQEINNKLRKFELSNFGGDQNNAAYILPVLKESHLESSLLCHKITKIFGLQLILSMASLFTFITTNSYNLCLTFISVQGTDMIIRMSVIFIWIVIFSSKLIFINHTCSNLVNEWKKAGVIIHQLETKFPNAVICKTILQFSIQMIQNKLSIVPLGFLELGHSFLQGFFSTIATYLIILIQMAPPPPPPEQQSSK